LNVGEDLAILFLFSMCGIDVNGREGRTMEAARDAGLADGVARESQPATKALFVMPFCLLVR
jgi:hypothetical protein